MPIKTADELRDVTTRILLAAGASERNAERVAEALVSAQLAGHDSHGVQNLTRYVQAIRAGELLPAAEPTIETETPTTALVRGHWTFGHVTTAFALRAALAKSAAMGVAVACAVEVNHIGRLGEYAELAATAGQIAEVMAGGFSEEQPVAVPHGGRKAVLNTNPIALGFPSAGDPSGDPMIVDFATTVIASGKVRYAQAKGEQLPPGCLVDRDGNPTTDPGALTTGGAHLPFGGHKGYGLMMAIELFGRVLSGADDYAAPERGGPIFRHSGVTIITINPAAFRPIADFRARTAELLDRVRAIPPAPGFAEVLAPGDPERRQREARLKNGIPVPDSTWEELRKLADSLGIDPSAHRD